MKNVYNQNIIFNTIFLLFFLTIIGGCTNLPQPPIEGDNNPPYILSEPNIVAYVGEEYQYIVEAYSEEGDTLSYSFEVAPSGMEIDSTIGVITWTPNLSQLGENQVEIKVSDNNLFSTQSFKITVSKINEENEEEEITKVFFYPLTHSVSLNSSITVDIKIDHVSQLKGASILLSFNTNRIQYCSANKTDFLPNAILLEQKIDNLNGEVIIDIAGLGIDSHVSGSGTLFTFTFNTVSAGDTAITFQTTELRDIQNKKIEHNVGSDCIAHIN